MTREEELKELELALSNGYGFENTKIGKELGFKESDLKLYAFNQKQSFARILDDIHDIFKKEECYYDEIKENFDQYKKDLVNFIEEQKGQSINGVIRTSEIKKSLEFYKENASEYDYNARKKSTLTVLDILRGNDFDIENKFRSGVLTLLTDNHRLEKLLTDDLRFYVTENKLDLKKILNVKKQSASQYAQNEMNEELNYHYANQESHYNKIKENLASATNIDIPNKLKAYVDNFKFESIYSTYEAFYKMMVNFSIDQVELSLEGEWNSLTELKNDKRGELISDVFEEKRDVDDGYYEYTEKVSVKIDDDIFSVERNYLKDIEGKLETEKWTKNGEFHRAGGLPAKINIQHHFIPSETYLDDASNEYWTNGVLTSVVDTTYSDILSNKSLAERQSIGCDVEDGLDEDNYEHDNDISYQENAYIKNIVEEYKEDNKLFDQTLVKNNKLKRKI